MIEHPLPGIEKHLHETLRTIRSTDPRFRWIANDFGEEPHRRVDLATMIDEQFVDLPDGDRRLTGLLDYLGDVITDMYTLNLVEELFDITVPLIPDRHLLSVLLRRLGWSGEFWYTEQEAAYALETSVSHVRNERAKLVREFRKGPVWAPVLHRCAAVAQELAPLTQTQFKAAFGIDLEGKWSMNLWGFLSALDLFGIDHWFHLENVRIEPTLCADTPVDFRYERGTLDAMVEAAETRITREIARQRRLYRKERLERQRYLDPWEIRSLRRSRHTDVGVGETVKLHWRDIPFDSAIRKKPNYDDLQFGAPLLLSPTNILQEPMIEVIQTSGKSSAPNLPKLLEEPEAPEMPPALEHANPCDERKTFGAPSASERPTSTDEHETPELQVENDQIDLDSLSWDEWVGHFTGEIDDASVRQLEGNNQNLAPIIDRSSSRCIGVVRTTRLRNKLTSGAAEIHTNDAKLQGIEVNRFITESELEAALMKAHCVYFNDESGMWGIVRREDFRR